MSVLEWRGGIPATFEGTVDTAGAINGAAAGPLILGGDMINVGKDGRVGPITSKWIRIRNNGTNALKVFFHEDHFNEDRNFLTIGANGTDVLEAPIEAREIFFRAATGTATFDVMALARRA